MHDNDYHSKTWIIFSNNHKSNIWIWTQFILFCSGASNRKGNVTKFVDKHGIDSDEDDVSVASKASKKSHKKDERPPYDFRNALQGNYLNMWYDQAKSVLRRWHSILSCLQDLNLHHLSYILQKSPEIGHLVSEIWVNVGFEKQYETKDLKQKKLFSNWWTKSYNQYYRQTIH